MYIIFTKCLSLIKTFCISCLYHNESPIDDTKPLSHAPVTQIETPKKYFNVKANQSGQKVKMAVEHHSAGLRVKDDSPIKLRDNAPNTLSQITSEMSEKESSIKKQAVP